MTFRNLSGIHFSVLLAAVSLAGSGVRAQTADRVTIAVDPTQVQVLPNHHPVWATSSNDLGAVPEDQPIQNLTLVLARSPEQEQAFEQLLDDQQNPGSPEYRNWLTSSEIGQRFGPSDDDIAAITAWLRSQGLQVTWVAPSRIFVRFGGAAADVGRAFQTELHYYSLHGKPLMSVSSDPAIPTALAPVIKAVRGLYAIEERPYHFSRLVQSSAPGLTITNSGVTYHFLTPTDFATIYALPTSTTGSGTTIGILGESRTNWTDFTYFRQVTGATFPNPTEVIPTAYGGIDPGSAYTAPPSCESNNSCSSAVTEEIDAQGEATLDVFRAGSVAPNATLLLVTASAASGGIEPGAQYLVQTTPTPAQVMSISFGACETEEGQAGVAFWNSLFQQAAGEGISVAVASGDAGASGCDTYFQTPPQVPLANSPNTLCSPGYVTCVGGTEFNDTSNPSTYWSATNNSSNLSSALTYIPEGAWNEPLNGSGSTQAASSGGGVSQFIATPSWQNGDGVPSARIGRYTPDIAFSAADHDGYFGCLAAIGASCVNGANGLPFVVFSGTSAAAPSMAGVAALLDQWLGGAQGNLNPEMYIMAANGGGPFHQVSIASSGVTNCTIATPSICNNSIPSSTGLTGGQAGFSLSASGGYSEVTGLGSLQINQFIPNYSNSTSKITPTVTFSLPSQSITTAQALLLMVIVSGGTGNPAPVGSITLTSGSFFIEAGLSNSSGDSSSVTLTIPAGKLAVGTDTLIATYTASGSTYNSAAGQASITVTSSAATTPTITWATPAAITYGTVLGAAQLNAATTVAGTFAYLPPAGTMLTAGQQTLNVTFTPTDTTDYTTATDSVTLTVSKATPTIMWTAPAAITYGTALSATQLDASANAAGSFSYSPSIGSVLIVGQQTLKATFTPTDATDYSSTTGSVTLTVNKATPSISWTTPAAVTVGTALSATQLDATASVPGAFSYNPALGTVMSTAGNETLSVTFTPNDATDYNTNTGSVTLVVNPSANPTFALSGGNISLAPGATSGNTSTVTVTPSGGFIGTVTLSAAVTSSPAGAVFPPTFSWTPSNGQVSITGAGNGTATLSILTTAASSGCNAENQSQRGSPWYSGSAALACLLFFAVPAKRRKWQALLGLVALCIALGVGVSACGGKSTGTACPDISVTGTTAGNYTITVTGTSGSTTATGTVTLTVQQ